MTARTGFHKKFKFRIEVGGVVIAAFQKMSELAMETGIVEYREGGSLIADKSPGLTNATDVTLERGIVDDLDLHNWFLDVTNAAADVGLPDIAVRRNLDLVQLERDNTERRRWRLVACWPSKYVAGEWDNDAEENVIEMLTLAFHFFRVV